MGGNAWTEPSPSDWERWEERLLDGEEPSAAARAVGQKGCSAFRRQNYERHAAALAAGREARASFVDDKFEGWALADDASDAVRIKWAQRHNNAYTPNRVELTGKDGGPVEIEHRGVKLSDIVRVAREAGVELGD